MKILIKQLILLLVLIPLSNKAQTLVQSNMTSIEIKSLNQAVQLYWDWKTDEDPITAIFLLEEITSKNGDNWVAPYWAAYIATQIANSTDENKLEYLNKARSYFDLAIGRYSYLINKEDKNISSNFDALNTLILRLKGYYYKSIDQEVKANEYLLKSIEQLNEGIKKSVDNPILMVLAATEIATAKNTNYGHIIAAISLLEKAKLEFKKIKKRNKTDITYWNEHWIDPWLNNLKPQNN